ncbi:MAG: nitronate monooxygenase [Bacteroidales bacterium]|nr:nitronate monooxygenase [Bacteroidales bacterium]
MNKICELFNIRYPIVQGGMVWCSGWKLAAAVSNAGGLGLIGAGSMDADLLQIHIQKAKQATSMPFGVNVPLLKKDAAELMQVILDENVSIVFTSAGNPSIWTPILKSKGVCVVHVVSSLKFAEKAQDAGVDAIVAEGFEAGGHNGREETTTFTLIPNLQNRLQVPLMAAGGIASGKAMAAAMILGADGVQIGSRFAVSEESSAHINFKKAVIRLNEGETRLTLKQLAPVRMIMNEFYNSIVLAENKGSSVEELTSLLGNGREKSGIFEGDLVNGALEIGQAAALIKDIQPVKNIINEIISEFFNSIHSLKKDNKFNFG